MSSDTQFEVSFEKVSCHFGEVRAVDQVSLGIRQGEFFTLLGPSGSGKTTCLRMIAGFQYPTEGRVHIHGQDASHLPPYERDVNTVFQDYALFPHMSVVDNVAYGLMVAGEPKAERRKKAEEMLALVKLSGYGARRPSELSGGQRQRVALARALIKRPKVLLLDEPLGALDLKLREEMQEELKSLQRKVGITFVLVTHDQNEALSMSDRLAVFNEGKVEQIGTPAEIYDHPKTAFVATFVGSSNVLSAKDAKRLAGEERALSLRPEKLTLSKDGQTLDIEAPVHADGTVADVQYMGAQTRYVVDMGDGVRLSIVRQNQTGAAPGFALGEAVTVTWSRSAHCYLV